MGDCGVELTGVTEPLLKLDDDDDVLNPKARPMVPLADAR